MEALDKIISSSSSESDIVELTKEQKIMLELSEQDIKNGKLISQEASHAYSAENGQVFRFKTDTFLKNFRLN